MFQVLEIFARILDRVREATAKAKVPFDKFWKAQAARVWRCVWFWMLPFPRALRTCTVGSNLRNFSLHCLQLASKLESPENATCSDDRSQTTPALSKGTLKSFACGLSAGDVESKLLNPNASQRQIIHIYCVATASVCCMGAYEISKV